MSGEQECPGCYQEVETYVPAEGALPHFERHADLDGVECMGSDEPVPQ